MELKITAAEAGQKILKYLLRKTDGTKIFLFKCFRKKKVKVNGKNCKPDYIIEENDTIWCPVLQEKDARDLFRNVDARITMLKLTSDLAAVDKAAGVLVHAAGGKDYSDTLVERTKAYLAAKGENRDFLVPVHRLDQNTSGVVLFARNYETAKAVNEWIRLGQIGKTYTALLEGVIDQDVFLSAEITRDKEYNQSRADKLIVNKKIPDKAEWLKKYYEDSSSISATVIHPLKNDGRFTLCKIELWTGRHHQIRAVCLAFGHPLAGDKKYGARSLAQRGQELICSRMEIPALSFEAESRFRIEF
ncbi:MAG: RluA family pseudouridine synthase [Spirochaetales bacterium]|nr:RluA family pseudouridine synthase [Spirochaetales bacterium]